MPARSNEEKTLAQLRSEIAAFGLTKTAGWDRERLTTALDRAHALKALKVVELKGRAQAAGAQVGDRPRKQDWLEALLQAEFAASSPAEDHPAKAPGAGGTLLRWSAAMGMTLAVLAMVLLPLGAWRLNQVAAAGLRTGGTWARQTADTLRQSSGALTSAADALDSSNQALRSVGTSLADAQPLLASIGDMLGTQAPDAISTARQSLISAQSGAQSIDRVLGSLSFLGIGYNPDQPLARGLADTADSLTPLPGALSEASHHLATTQKDIGQVSLDVVQVSDDLGNMSAQISPVALELEREADQLEGLADRIDQTADRMSILIWAGTLLAELLLLNGAITQYAVWTVGRSADGRA